MIDINTYAELASDIKDLMSLQAKSLEPSDYISDMAYAYRQRLIGILTDSSLRGDAESLFRQLYDKVDVVQKADRARRRASDKDSLDYVREVLKTKGRISAILVYRQLFSGSLSNAKVSVDAMSEEMAEEGS